MLTGGYNSCTISNELDMVISYSLKETDMKSFFLIVLSVIVLFYPLTAFAGTEQLRKDLGGSLEPKEHELKYLPKYCKCKGRGENVSSADKKKCRAYWQKVFEKYPHGQSWIHLHHYCYALTYLHRYQMGIGNPSALLKAAENEIRYMIKHSHPKFKLMPEYLYRMGTTQQLMGKDDKALEYFYQSIKSNNKYVPAYMKIIQYYQSVGDIKKAVQIAKTGLKYSPDSSRLKKKLAELQSLAK